MAWFKMPERVFQRRFKEVLKGVEVEVDFVTGPGRSGAVASVYASHILGVPYKPHKCGNYSLDKRVLLVDTVKYTGKTLNKARNWYEKRGLEVVVCYGFLETKGYYFKMWYET